MDFWIDKIFHRFTTIHSTHHNDRPLCIQILVFFVNRLALQAPLAQSNNQWISLLPKDDLNLDNLTLDDAIVNIKQAIRIKALKLACQWLSNLPRYFLSFLRTPIFLNDRFLEGRSHLCCGFFHRLVVDALGALDIGRNHLLLFWGLIYTVQRLFGLCFHFGRLLCFGFGVKCSF